MPENEQSTPSQVSQPTTPTPPPSSAEPSQSKPIAPENIRYRDFSEPEKRFLPDSQKKG